MGEMRRVALAACAAAAMIVPTAAMAQLVGGPDSGSYMGGTVGQATANDFCTGVSGPGTTCEEKDTSWSVFVGYQVNRNLGFEFGYRDFGERSAITTGAGGVSTRIESKVFEFVGMGILPFGERFQLYGKFGAYFGETDTVRDFGVTGTQSDADSNIDLTYGIGVQYALTKQWGLRAEWQRYQDMSSGTVDLDAVAIGVVYRFK
jgi:OmpA-OmpF porin, OOP family